MIPVLVAIGLITIVVIVTFRWFERYRYTETWRRSEFRGWAFGFLMWFGGLFGHRLPPPPQAKVEFTAKRDGSQLPTPGGDGSTPPTSGGAPLPDDAPHEEQ